MNLSVATIAASLPRALKLPVFAKIAALTAAVFLAACGSTNTPPVTAESIRPADVIFAEGMAAMEARRFRTAIEAFAELDQFYPFTEQAAQGLALSVFAGYQSRDYDLAIFAANRYLLAYPTYPDADFVLYYLGESHLRTVPDITRDQEAAREALQADEELLARFPNSEFADDARLNIIAINDQLAGQEMLIGRYYQERRDYPGAINRFRVVVTEYQNTRHVEEALFRLTETYLAMGLLGEAQTAAAVLGFNFPDSTWYDEAYALLGTVGVVPVDAPRGWLADAFNRN